MKKLFEYCYYRISKAYRKLDDKDYCLYGSLVVFTVFAFNALALTAVVFSILHLKMSVRLVTIVAVAFGICSLFFIDKRKFDKLELQYKGERHHKLKGWLVFLWIICSAVLYFVAITLLDV